MLVRLLTDRAENWTFLSGTSWYRLLPALQVLQVHAILHGSSGSQEAAGTSAKDCSGRLTCRARAKAEPRGLSETATVTSCAGGSRAALKMVNEVSTHDASRQMSPCSWTGITVRSQKLWRLAGGVESRHDLRGLRSGSQEGSGQVGRYSF